LGGYSYSRSSAETRGVSTRSVLVVGAFAKASVAGLAECGFATTSCSNAKRALELLRRRRYGAVLCDIDIPGSSITGFPSQVCEEFPAVAVIVVVQPGELRRGLLAIISGASGYLQAPPQAGEATLSVRSALLKKSLECTLSGTSNRRQRKKLWDAAA
jgi:DNA-binding NtrC family response regulator